MRKIAHSFNRQHAANGHTVSKTYVANTIAANLYAIHQLKATRKTQAHAPKAGKINRTRGLDFTGKQDSTGALHQRSQQHCPWQNGRIERLFGTLKQQLRQLQFTGAAQLQTWLNNFVTWYNDIRPHQHLNGRTPQEVWQGIDYAQDKPKQVTWWSAENGQLSGVKLRW